MRSRADVMSCQWVNAAGGRAQARVEPVGRMQSGRGAVETSKPRGEGQPRARTKSWSGSSERVEH